MDSLNIKYPFQESFLDYPDNINSAILIYIMGCDHYCNGCLNFEFIKNDFNIGTKIFKILELEKELRLSSIKFNTNKFVLLGGDPLSRNNLHNTKNLLDYYGDIYDFCVYTGYLIDYVISNNIKRFKYIKCGKYYEELKQQPIKTNEKLVFASKNQKLYNNKYELISDNGIYYFK